LWEKDRIKYGREKERRNRDKRVGGVANESVRNDSKSKCDRDRVVKREKENGTRGGGENKWESENAGKRKTGTRSKGRD
jgi:hypothetical protein